MTIVDASLTFTFVNIGCNGKINSIFGNCSLHDKLESFSMMVPLPNPLPRSRNAVPYAMSDDEAFPFKYSSYCIHHDNSMNSNQS